MRHGVTLIELLVVIAIVTILAALLLAAVMAVRSRSDRVVCAARQRDLALAARAFASAKGRLPTEYADAGEMMSGYVDLTPEMGHRTIHDRLVAENRPHAMSGSEGTIDWLVEARPTVLVCPAGEAGEAGSQQRHEHRPAPA